MFNNSLYFPSIYLFSQPPSLFLKSEDVDEERLLSEAESTLDHMETLIKSRATDQFVVDPGNPSRLGRSSVDSQMSHSHTPANQHSGAQIQSSSPSNSSSDGSSASEMDTGPSVQSPVVLVSRNMPPSGSTPVPERNSGQPSFW